ncbi:MAG: hypothetical protein GY787_15985 [Alteromonadales bacterium]|nr:hypothetical protein [Alteromonadales bacterium]
MLNKYKLSTLFIALSLSVGVSAQPYQWDNNAAVKLPSEGNNNGKTVLFDVSHGGVEGNADWVIDGGFSDFADALVEEGYTVKEYRGIDLNNDGLIRFYDDRTASSSQNEAVITYQGIQDADVLVLAETNRPFTLAEQQALEQFVADGKGIYFVADHYDADRNLNTWDATEVFNGYNRSDLDKYNLGGEYGDWRNPKMADAGWLVDNFGIRFRFNGVDHKQGVSGVVAANKTEGITAGVQPILMAAGATLAIVDEQKAKGLVYFAASDDPVKWKYAKDSGLYFGGEAEGPYVAIAKSGAGKAAFIGDSSPIEDATPKYKRQDTGQTKRTYPGWTDSGNAATLSINIINWLATPESYHYFDNNNGHTTGFATQTPMADQEKSDPNNGQPWGSPAGNFNAWDTDSYQDNSFNAPYGDGQVNPEPTPAPTPNETVSVTQALAASQGEKLTVRGSVSSAINGLYGLLLTDINAPENSIYIKLESSQRNDFNPELNPAIVNQQIIVSGTRGSYMNEVGIRDVSDIQLAPTALSVEQALAASQGETITLTGTVVDALNGEFALLLADSNNSALIINIKLESSQRAQFSPQLNPTMLGATIQVKGLRGSYLGEAGIRDVSDIELLDIPLPPIDEPLSVSDVLQLERGTPVILSGQIKRKFNGKRGLKLIDPSQPEHAVFVKLKPAQREQFSPKLNPSLIGKTLRVEGIFKRYKGKAGIKHVSSLTLID